ncbi:MAG: multidrug effflux MFS transporter [Oxalicibacterium faecigallinarum]|uniref:multidrug effflux MFS transporter n=1 Tax=Oxalicibacterium faecigallinarum TaxID=573741 RepID=UPI002808029A|nr:multidrug effflux MFS transporter [Oxalicibacterium faecigallinarum]MDQ7968347.1 multidrug effflux MFS transporter [Oxalicibacterium faecigallinarum]
MNNHFFKNALVLGLLSAIGPFAIDMYLPALPSIGQSLNAQMPAVQASLMAFFISLAIGQLFYGPISDMFGRKLPLYFGLALFAVCSVGCALAPDIETLIVLRFLQGLGASAGMVIPRAIVRDLHTGNDAAKLMALLMLVFSVSPILAPLAGSFLIEWMGWRSVFWSVTVAAVLALILLATGQKETRPAHERAGSSVRGALQAYWLLLRDWRFLGLVFIGAFGISSFFAYLANSSFVLINHYGLTPRQYSIAFAANAAAFIGVSQLTGNLTRRFGLVPLVKFAVRGYALFMLALLAMNQIGIERLDVMLVMLFVGFGFLGLVIPTTAVLALEEHGAIAGTASALMGTLQFVTGAVVMAVVGLFADGTASPMVAGIAGCAVLAALVSRLTLPHVKL